MNISSSNQTNPVLSANVAVVSCPSYDRKTVDAAIVRGLSLLGGAAAFAKQGENLLFKPNMLWGTEPEKCVVTHPEVLRGTVNAFGATGATLFYGDSPAGVQNIDAVVNKCGYTDALAGIPVALAPFDKGIMVDVKEGRAGKKLTIARTVLDATGIINVAKLKTHGLTRMTGAIKNLYGCIPVLIKGEYHARFPDVYAFSQLLADIAFFIKPRLHIIDAVFAMEGNGPQSGTPKKLGVIIMSTDPVAADIIGCKLMNLDPAHVPTIAAGAAVGLGCGDSGAIKLFGDPIEPFIDPSFDVVRMPPVSLPDTSLLGTIKRFFLPRPVINRKRCTRCIRCISICPITPSVLTQKSKRMPPEYDYARCIRCYCCQEVCPSKAIDIRYPVLRRLLPIATYFSLFITRIRVRKHHQQ